MMTPREGVFYAGWMAGIIATVPICRSLGMHKIVGLIIGVAVGAGIGFVAQKLFDNFKNNRPDDSDRF